MKSFFQKLNANKSKKLAIALAVALSAATFAGCSLGSSTTPAKNTSSSAQQTQQANLDNLSDARNTPTVRAAAAVGPSVVGITNKAVARDFFNNPVESQGVGSGVIFKNDGGKSYIVTNNHVVDGASELIVSLSDGRSLPGKLVGADALTDLAVVQVDDGNLPTADFGDSDATVVGESVIAIGNPMGLEFQGSVTSGVVSALNRTLGDGDARIKLVQTDAAINP
ncbi:S1C family serine protease, partial [Mitsuokella jalaludinii]